MQRDLRKNYLYNTVYQTLNIIIPLITAPYLARVLGAEKIGVYAYSYSIVYYFMMFAMLGVNNYGNRTCAMCRDDKSQLSKTFCEIYSFQLMCSLVSLIVYLIATTIWHNEYYTISLILVGFVLSAAFDINWFFFGLEEFKLTTLRNIIVRIIITVFIFVFVKKAEDLFIYAIIMSLGTLLNQLIMWPYLRRYITLQKVCFSDISKHIGPNLVLFIPVIAVSLYKIMDKIMLGGMSTMVETGYYENTEKLMNIPLGFINALGVVMLPRMSNLNARKEIEKAKGLLSTSFLFVSILSVSMAFGLAAIAEEFVPVFFGTDFLPVIRLVKWIAPTMIFFSFANVIRTQYLLPNKKDKSYIISVFIGAIVNLSINYIMIPIYAAWGAVIGTLVAEAIVCIVQMMMVRNEIDIMRYALNAAPFLLIGIAMYFLVRLSSGIFESAVLSLIFEIIIGGLFYLGITIIYLWLFKKDFLEMLGINNLLIRKNRK